MRTTRIHSSMPHALATAARLHPVAHHQWGATGYGKVATVYNPYMLCNANGADGYVAVSPARAIPAPRKPAPAAIEMRLPASVDPAGRQGLEAIFCAYIDTFLGGDPAGFTLTRLLDEDRRPVRVNGYEGIHMHAYLMRYIVVLANERRIARGLAPFDLSQWDALAEVPKSAGKDAAHEAYSRWVSGGRIPVTVTVVQPETPKKTNCALSAAKEEVLPASLVKLIGERCGEKSCKAIFTALREKFPENTYPSELLFRNMARVLSAKNGNRKTPYEVKWYAEKSLETYGQHLDLIQKIVLAKVPLDTVQQTEVLQHVQKRLLGYYLEGGYLGRRSLGKARYERWIAAEIGHGGNGRKDTVGHVADAARDIEKQQTFDPGKRTVDRILDSLPPHATVGAVKPAPADATQNSVGDLFVSRLDNIFLAHGFEGDRIALLSEYFLAGYPLPERLTGPAIEAAEDAARNFAGLWTGRGTGLTVALIKFLMGDEKLDAVVSRYKEVTEGVRNRIFAAAGRDLRQFTLPVERLATELEQLFKAAMPKSGAGHRPERIGAEEVQRIIAGGVPESFPRSWMKPGGRKW